jgi:hypothetical protein
VDNFTFNYFHGAGMLIMAKMVNGMLVKWWVDRKVHKSQEDTGYAKLVPVNHSTAMAHNSIQEGG